MISRNLNQFRAFVSHQRLVGGGYMLPLFQHRLNEGISRLHASHGLHNNGNLRILRDGLVIMNDLVCNRFALEISQIQHILQFQSFATSLGDHLFIHL